MNKAIYSMDINSPRGQFVEKKGDLFKHLHITLRCNVQKKEAIKYRLQ